MVREGGFPEYEAPDIENPKRDEYDSFWDDIEKWAETTGVPNATEAEKEASRSLIDATDTVRPPDFEGETLQARGAGASAQELSQQRSGFEEKIDEYRTKVAELRPEVERMDPTADAEMITKKKQEITRLDDAASEYETRQHIWQKVWAIPPSDMRSMTGESVFQAHRRKLRAAIKAMDEKIRFLEPQHGHALSDEEQQEMHTLRRYRNRMKWTLFYTSVKGRQQRAIDTNIPDPILHYYPQTNLDDPYELEV